MLKKKEYKSFNWKKQEWESHLSSCSSFKKGCLLSSDCDPTFNYKLIKGMQLSIEE